MLAENLVDLLGTKLVAAFIHQVVPLSETATRKRKGQVRVHEEVAAGWPQQWREQNIFMGSDYTSLAVEVATFLAIAACLLTLRSSIRPNSLWFFFQPDKTLELG